MFFIMSVLCCIIGIILIFNAKKIVKDNISIYIIRFIGIILTILSLIIIYMLLTGKIVLPLSRS